MAHDIGCLRAIEAFYAYLDGELDDPESIADFEHHLGHCRSCFSRIEMDFVTYTEENLARFEQALEVFNAMERP